MKTILPIFIIGLFAFWVSNVLAQDAAKNDCPKFQLWGPPGITEIGNDISFTVKFTENQPTQPVKYRWAISNHRDKKILDKIAVEESDTLTFPFDGNGVTVNVEIGGLRDGCLTMASETIPGHEHLVAE